MVLNMGTNTLAAWFTSAMARLKQFFARGSSGGYFRRGCRYFEKGQHDKAIADFAEAIRLDPKNADKYSWRAWYYSEKGEHDKFIAFIADFSEAIRLDFSVADQAIRLVHARAAGAYIYRGVCYFWQGELDNAIADFTEAIRLGHPPMADAYNYRGVCHYVKGFAPVPPYDTVSADLYAAIDDFEEAIRLDPKMAVAYYNRGRCQINLANLSYANQQPRVNAIAECPGVQSIDLVELTVPGAVLKLVSESEARENVVLPLSCDNGVLRIVMSNPDDFDMLKKLRFIFNMDIERLFAPREQLIEAINRHYCQGGMELVGAEFSAAFGDNLIAFAIEDFTEAIQLDPNKAGNYYWRASCYGRRGEHDQAIADYTEASRLDPKAAVAYSDRGQCHTQKGEHDQAIADFSEAIRLDPKGTHHHNWSPRYERGRCYEQTGEHDKAIADFKEAMEWLLQGEEVMLLAHLNEAIRLHPQVAENYYWRGRFYQVYPSYNCESGDSEFDLSLVDEAAPFELSLNDETSPKPPPSKATADFTKAIQLDPTVADYYYWRAESTGESKEAIADCSEAIRLDPNKEEAYFNRGHSFCRTGELDKAIADYTEVLRLLKSPNAPYSGILTREHLMREAYYYRSLAYFESGDQDKGRADEMQSKRLSTFGPFNPARIIG
jgi:tetratricopeptide (TPR) repeat protein